MKDMTEEDRTWFKHLSGHLATKQSGSIISTLESTYGQALAPRGKWQQESNLGFVGEKSRAYWVTLLL